VLSILQIVLAILLVIFASLSFASFFTDKVKAFHGASLVLLGLTVALMLVNACTFKLSNMVSLAIGTMDIDMEFSTVQVCVTVFMLLLMAVFTVLRVTVDKRKITVGCFVKHALSIAFAVALLISVYAPVITTEVKAQFKNSETAKRETSSMTGGIFAYFDLSEYQEENFEYMLEENEIQEAVEWQFSRFENYTKREFAKGKGTAAEVNQSVFSYLLLGWGGYEYSDLYALGTVAMMIVILCAVLIIWKNIQEFATGKRLPSFVSVLTKLFAFLMVLTVVAEIIAMCIFVNYNAKTVDIIYKSSIAYGPILMSIFAVILACIPSAESKRN